MTQYYDINEWVDIDIGHECNDCGHETEFRACGDSNVRLTCGNIDCSCYPTCSILRQVDYTSEEPNWILPNGEKFSYTCPNCDSDDINRKGYDDGCGYVDVKVECRNCGTETWE